MDFDEVIVDADGRTVPTAPGGPRVVRGDLAVLAAGFGAAARSPLRASGPERFRAAGAALRVRSPAYVVAGVDDLRDTGIAGAAGPQGDTPSYTVARQALERHVETDPAARGRLQVVAAFQAEDAE
jgi:hypothetical protein